MMRTQLAVNCYAMYKFHLTWKNNVCLHVRVCVWKFPSWKIMWSCLHVHVCVLASSSVSASTSQSQSRHVVIRRIWKLRRAHTPRVQLWISRHVLCVCVHTTSIRETCPLDRMVPTMSPKVKYKCLRRRTSERARTSSSSSRSCSRLVSLLTFNILDAVMVYTLKWWPGSCQSRRVLNCTPS